MSVPSRINPVFFVRRSCTIENLFRTVPLYLEPITDGLYLSTQTSPDSVRDKTGSIMFQGGVLLYVYTNTFVTLHRP